MTPPSRQDPMPTAVNAETTVNRFFGLLLLALVRRRGHDPALHNIKIREKATDTLRRLFAYAVVAAAFSGFMGARVEMACL